VLDICELWIVIIDRVSKVWRKKGGEIKMYF